MGVNGVDGIEQKVRVELRPQKIQFISHLFLFDLFDIHLRPHPVGHHFGGHDKEHPKEDIDERFIKNIQAIEMNIMDTEKIFTNQVGYRYPQPGRCRDHSQEAGKKFEILFLVQQLRYGIQRVEIIIGRYKNQVAKLDRNRSRDDKRTIPENIYPEKVGQQPEG
jgi:hypothetical protein